MGIILTNVLITGATGFIGSHLAHRLSKDKSNTIVILVRDCKTGPWLNWLKEFLSKTFRVRGDILNLKLLTRVLVQYEIEQVYHFAAQAIVKKALKDPINTYEINVMGTLNLLEACRQAEVDKVLIQSTDKVYGEKLAANPEDPPIAGGIYETSKACADLIAQSYMKTYEMNIVIPRSCNVYGYDLSPRIIPNTIRQCLRHQDPIIFKGEKTMRQYIYVEDLVDALIHLMNGDYTGVFNVATHDVFKQEEVVKTILRVGNFKHLKPRYVEREKPIKEIKMQSMIPSDFGWEPRYTFEKGIKETIQKFKKYGF